MSEFSPSPMLQLKSIFKETGMKAHHAKSEN